MSFDVSPILDVAWWLLQFSFSYIWMICVIIFAWIVARASIDTLNNFVHSFKPGGSRRSAKRPGD